MSIGFGIINIKLTLVAGQQIKIKLMLNFGTLNPKRPSSTHRILKMKLVLHHSRSYNNIPNKV